VGLRVGGMAGLVKRPEEELQRAIVSLLYYCRPRCLWWANTTQRGTRKRFEMAVLKAMGARPGVADLCFFNVGVIELKTARGRLSPAQEAFRDECFALGVNWALCRSIDEVLYALRAWGVTFAIEPVFT